MGAFAEAASTFPFQITEITMRSLATVEADGGEGTGRASVVISAGIDVGVVVRVGFSVCLLPAVVADDVG